MNFEELLAYKSPEAFEDGTIYWEFAIGRLKSPELKRTGDTGHYSSDNVGGSKVFRFDNFEKFREAYISVHEENIQRLKTRKGQILEIGPLRSDTWPPWGKDNCG